MCVEGTRGSGKTDGLLMDFAQHCGHDTRTKEERAAGFPQRTGFGDAWRGVIFRRTYPQLADVVAKSKRWFNTIFAGSAKFNAGDYVWTWRTGEQLLFRHFSKPDDYWNYHGHEYPFIGWEELTSWPSLDCYESMFACNRSSHPSVPRKMRSTTNPFGVGHNAVKRYFVDPMPAGVIHAEEREIPAIEDGQLIRKRVLLKRVRIHSSYLENPKLLAADPMYLANIEKIKDANKRRAWLFGDWNITSGGMFDDIWDARKHVLKAFDIPSSWRVNRSFDWGSSRPFSVGWWAESDGTTAKLADGTEKTFPRGTLFRVAEWYGCTEKPNEGLRLPAKKVAAGIIERQATMKFADRVKPGPADSSIYDVTDEGSIADNMASAPNKVTWEKADKRSGSRKNGWESIRDRLDAVTSGTDEPGLYVFENCREFLRTFPSIPRSDKDPDDVDTDAEDHIADETRYRILQSKPMAMSMTMGRAI
jgi:hypothetical protein